MHSVLDLKSDRTIAQHNEALEERLGEACPCGFLIHDNGAKLLMVTDEDYLPTSEHKWDHTFWKRYSVSQKFASRKISRTWLGGLSSFIDKNSPEL